MGTNTPKDVHPFPCTRSHLSLMNPTALHALIHSVLQRLRHTAPISLFCGHDTTVAPFYKLLTGKSPAEWVPYGSHLTLELWEEPVQRSAGGECAGDRAGQACRAPRLFVRALFNGKEVDIPRCTTALGRSFCSLEDFVALMARWRVSYAECYA